MAVASGAGVERRPGMLSTGATDAYQASIPTLRAACWGGLIYGRLAGYLR